MYTVMTNIPRMRLWSKTLGGFCYLLSSTEMTWPATDLSETSAY
jgi:hypothetical protein